jgi:hypothetical protein
MTSQFDIECSQLEIEHNLEMLMPKLQRKINDWHTTYLTPSQVVGKSFLSETKPPLLTMQPGRVYWKMTLENRNDFGGSSSSVYAFIRKKDGAIFKPATWRQPETRTQSAIRGHVTDEFAEDYFTAHGVIYAL